MRNKCKIDGKQLWPAKQGVQNPAVSIVRKGGNTVEATVTGTPFIYRKFDTFHVHLDRPGGAGHLSAVTDIV